ncbi:MAG: MaoC family dehydratase N-terminal domain-containing protein [Chloroflexi bacterium]|nr:MaoC family dehydratase N-terminal domain-containing protein [Chloroflexota bacterium]
MSAPLAAGQRIGPLQLHLTPSLVACYLSAVGDASGVYHELSLAPPTALAAFALRALLEQTGLPPGTMHLAQELASYRSVALGEVLSCEGMATQRRQRRDGDFLALEFTLADAQGNPVMEGKSTLLTPGQGA